MNKIKNYLSKIYSKSDLKYIESILENDLEEPKHKNIRNDWFKEQNLYVAYPESFKFKDKNPINAFRQNLDTIKNLGFTGIHILPFFESPMIDMGFDIQNFYEIRDDLGTTSEFYDLVDDINERNLTLFIDIVLNHVSYRHIWFQKAIRGSEKHRNYFIHRKEKPRFLKKFFNERGHFGRYEIDGKEVDIRIIFPEQAGDIPHWVKAEDGYWYYHTFYPHQLDLNWDNKDVFVEMANVLIHWARKGVSFRLDAIPYLGKEPKKGIFESSYKTHDIIKSLYELVSIINPDSIFLAEAFQSIDKTVEYFGQPDAVESNLAYNFHLAMAIWTSLVTKNSKYISDTLNETMILPEWGQWVTFLRNHDELSLEHAKPELKKLLYDSLITNGLSFRDDNLAGRTFSLLGDSIERHILAYSILFSIPGNPAVIYGDELAKKNDFENMKNMIKYKLAKTGDEDIAEDTRDINRGFVKPEDKQVHRAKVVMKSLSKLMKTRKKYPIIYTQKPRFISKNPFVLHIIYELDKNVLICILNLNNKKEEIILDNFDKNSKTLLEINGGIIDTNNEVLNLAPYACVWIEETKK